MFILKPASPVLDRELQYGVRSVGTVLLNRMFHLSHIPSEPGRYAQLMDQFVVHVVERIIGEKSVVHESLTKSNKRQVVVVKGIARHPKENRAQRSIFIGLKPMMNLKTALKHHFQTSCIFKR